MQIEPDSMSQPSAPDPEKQTSPVATHLSTKEIARTFLKLGCVGFGGPLAHLPLVQREIVERKRWLSQDEFLQGLTLAQILPGPLSTKLVVYAGYRLGSVRGAFAAGGAFILPAFFMLLILTWSYFRFGAIPAVQGLFYGMTPVVLAMILAACCQLGRSVATDWPLRALLAASVLLVALLRVNLVLLFAMGAILGLLLYGPLRLSRQPRCWSVVWPALPLLLQLSWFFLKVGALIFGGGLVIVPFIEQEVVERLGWLTRREFLDALDLGQITPGPVVITATFIGYKVAGWAGAIVATIAIFLPSFVLTLLGANYLRRKQDSPVLQAALRGINAAAVGAIAGSLVSLARFTLLQPLPLAVCLLSVLAMMRYHIGFLWLLGAGAGLGLAAGWMGWV